MSANFNPELGGYSGVGAFRFFCQKVLPTVYDDSLSYYELLCKLVDMVNKLDEDVETAEDNITKLSTAYEQLENYVNTYFDSLDITTEINNKLDAMALDGTLEALLIDTFTIDSNILQNFVTDWLDEHVTPGTEETPIVVDDTLTISGAAADAAVVGDMFTKFGATLTKPSVTWELGTRIMSDGEVRHDTDKFAASEIIPCLGGDRFINKTPAKDAQDHSFTMYICTYTTTTTLNDTFVARYGFSSASGRNKIVDANITGIRYSFGCQDSDDDMSLETINTYWDVEYWVKPAPLERIIDVENVLAPIRKGAVLVTDTNYTGDLDELPAQSFVRSVGATNRPSFISLSTGFWVMTTKSGTNWMQVGIHAVTGRIVARYSGSTGGSPSGYSAWAESGIYVDSNSNYTDDLNDLEANTFVRSVGANNRPDSVGSSTGFWVLSLKSSTNRAQIGFLANKGKVFTRYGAQATPMVYSNWFENTTEGVPLKILCIGNSFTEDNMGYVPFIVSNVAPRLNLTLGISYYGGASIEDYEGFFDNNTAALKYEYSINGGNWGATADKTLKEILVAQDWDIITFQQKSTDQDDFTTFDDLNSLINKVYTYCASQNHKPPKFGWLMPQATVSQNMADILDCIYGNGSTIAGVLPSTPIEFVIPCGTAVNNARQTSLDDLGAASHLAADATGHLQDGIPCLIGAYTATLKICELVGMNYVGIMGENTRPTDQWIENRHVQGRNTPSVGVTDANCYIAQKCAIAAIKYPESVASV